MRTSRRASGRAATPPPHLTGAAPRERAVDLGVIGGKSAIAGGSPHCRGPLQPRSLSTPVPKHRPPLIGISTSVASGTSKFLAHHLSCGVHTQSPVPSHHGSRREGRSGPRASRPLPLPACPQGCTGTSSSSIDGARRCQLLGAPEGGMGRCSLATRLCRQQKVWRAVLCHLGGRAAPSAPGPATHLHEDQDKQAGTGGAPATCFYRTQWPFCKSKCP